MICSHHQLWICHQDGRPGNLPNSGGGIPQIWAKTNQAVWSDEHEPSP